MATIIKLKRGTTTPTTSNLANGEVAIDTSARRLYINDNGTIKPIIGNEVAAAALGGDVRSYTGDGSTTGYTVSIGADVENVLVFVNGVYQRPTTDYTVLGTTLTFGTAPASADAITIKELVEGINTISFIDDGSNTVDIQAGNSLTLAGGTGITSSISGSTATFDIDSTVATLTGTQTLTNKTIDANSNTLSNIPNASLTNSSITINGSSVALGGSTTISTASSLTIEDDSASTSSINLNSDTLTVAGGTGITTSVLGTTLTITGSATQNTFSTININDTTDVAADSTTDTLHLDSTGLISITGDASTDTITVGTVSSATIPFLKADGFSSNIDLQTSGTLADVITNLYIPFTISDGTSVNTLVVA